MADGDWRRRTTADDDGQRRTTTDDDGRRRVGSGRVRCVYTVLYRRHEKNVSFYVRLNLLSPNKRQLHGFGDDVFMSERDGTIYQNILFFDSEFKVLYPRHEKNTAFWSLLDSGYSLASPWKRFLTVKKSEGREGVSRQT